MELYHLRTSVAGPQFHNFSWPSLYPPAIEVGFLGPPARPGGYYLSSSLDIFTFTLYWTLIFHLPFSFIAGLYAFFNFLFPPVRTIQDPIVLAAPPLHAHARAHSRLRSHSFSQGRSRSHSRSQPDHNTDPSALPPPNTPQPSPDWPKPRVNARRSRLVFALLVLLSFLTVSLLTAVAGAIVLSCVIVGVYSAGGMYVSTWIPFVWAVIQGLVALLSVWPTVVDII